MNMDTQLLLSVEEAADVIGLGCAAVSPTSSRRC